jgi:guanylate kinase
MGTVVIFGGPNGAGKDTLEADFREAHANVSRIVRHITRPPAPGEEDGQDYYFVDETQFNTMAADGQFVEYAAYPGVKSGTTLREIDQRVREAEVATITATWRMVLRYTINCAGWDGAASVYSLALAHL